MKRPSAWLAVFVTLLQVGAMPPAFAAGKIVVRRPEKKAEPPRRHSFLVGGKALNAPKINVPAWFLTMLKTEPMPKPPLTPVPAAPVPAAPAPATPAPAAPATPAPQVPQATEPKPAPAMIPADVPASKVPAEAVAESKEPEPSKPSAESKTPEPPPAASQPEPAASVPEPASVAPVVEAPTAPEPAAAPAVEAPSAPEPAAAPAVEAPKEAKAERKEAHKEAPKKEAHKEPKEAPPKPADVKPPVAAPKEASAGPKQQHKQVEVPHAGKRATVRNALAAIHRTADLLKRARESAAKGKKGQESLRKATVLQRAARHQLVKAVDSEGRPLARHARAWLALRLTMMARHQVRVALEANKVALAKADDAQTPTEDLDGYEQPPVPEQALSRAVADADPAVAKEVDVKKDESTTPELDIAGAVEECAGA